MALLPIVMLLLKWHIALGYTRGRSSCWCVVVSVYVSGSHLITPQGQHEIRVGTLLTWADRILSFVEKGDFLSAIELARSYYVGEAPGNRNGLPDDPRDLRKIVGEKMHDLMVASAHYAFSEDRMMDSTHHSADGRGVDRTSLFEGLVATCARACAALGDFDFFFEDLFSYYDNFGISRIFLTQLEPFILDGITHHVPPRITQKLIALHDENGRPDSAERIIWHIDPECLDINQSILLCQRYKLYDALLYVYMRAMKDYVSPLVQLLGLIRQVQRYRRLRAEASPSSRAYLSDNEVEDIAVNAYKIYPYLGNVLTGLTYPSGGPLPSEDAIAAKDEVYTFLFAGRSSMHDGRLVLTSDEENGVEPTYPYARLLLRFDAEAFLHTLDLAFEDDYFHNDLDDQPRIISQLMIVKVLLEILSSPDTRQSDATFINIFIARNVPKYPQFIQMAPSVLHAILISLAEDPDDNTQEDRQLAAEYLLSAYTPHEGDRIIRLFEQAGFYRILRSWHRHEHHWAPLIQAYLRDNEITAAEKFVSLDEVLATAAKYNKQSLPPDVSLTVTESLPLLLGISIPETALLLDRRLPALHENVMAILADHSLRDRFLYLRTLLATAGTSDENRRWIGSSRVGPSTNVPESLRVEYLKLLCDIEPEEVVIELQHLPSGFLDRTTAARICEEQGLYDAVIWCTNDNGDPAGALKKATEFVEQFSDKLAHLLQDNALSGNTDSFLSSIKNIQRRAVDICIQQSKAVTGHDSELEENWFQLLRSEISCVYRVSLSCSSAASAADPSEAVNDLRSQAERFVLAELRSSVHETFNSLLSVSASKALSFPRLFKRLVDVKDARVSKGVQYTEFRAILGGMLESYRSEGDMLVLTKHLMSRDLFDAVDELAKARGRGWAPLCGMCSSCGERLYDKGKKAMAVMVEGQPELVEDSTIIVSQTGSVYHRKCLPKQDTTNSLQ
jgi:vacuolar protein sorting-associated protein 8